MVNHKEIPVLFTTYNRLDFTKKSLKSLLDSECGEIYIFDNNSTDGTQKWLKAQKNKNIKLRLNKKNFGVSGAMNYFFEKTKNKEFVAKVDNDTIVEKDWLKKLLDVSRELNLDLVQAKHPIYKLSHPSGSFDEWMKEKEQDKKNKKIFYSDHVGGSGVIIRRSKINAKLNSEWVLGGWDKFQEKNKKLLKAFYAGTEIDLLDTKNGEIIDTQHEKYYKETARYFMVEIAKQRDWIEHVESDIKKLNDELDSIRNTRWWKSREFFFSLINRINN